MRLADALLTFSACLAAKAHMLKCVAHTGLRRQGVLDRVCHTSEGLEFRWLHACQALACG